MFRRFRKETTERESARDIESALNCSEQESAEIGREFAMKSHPFIQNNMMYFINAYLEAMANKIAVDARNREAVEYSKRLTKTSNKAMSDLALYGVD